MKNFLLARLKSFPPAFSGIKHVLIYEKNTWLHLSATIGALVFSIFFRISSLEWLFIFSAIFIVWICELINTAIERTVDLITKEKNCQIKIIKDVAAGAVFLSAVYAVIIGLIIFIPKIHF